MRLGLLSTDVDPRILCPDRCAPSAIALAPALPPAVDEPAKAAGRSDAIDAARFVALVAVVLSHAVRSDVLEPLRSIGTLSGPSLFYICLGLHFQARSFRRNPDQSVLRHLLNRGRRLYLPFLAWSIIFWAATAGWYVLVGDTRWRQVWADPAYLLSGTSPHLWFLPYLIFCLLVAAAVAPFCATSTRVRRTVVAVSALGGAALLFVPRPDWLNHYPGAESVFYLNSWKAMPATLFGLAIAWAVPDFRWRPGPRGVALWLVGLAAVAVMVTAVAIQLHAGYSKSARTASGVAWAAFALAGTRGPWVGALGRLGRYGFGAYLSHAVFVSTTHAGLAAMGFKDSATTDVVMIAAGLIGGLLTAYLLGKFKGTAWLVGERAPTKRLAR